MGNTLSFWENDGESKDPCLGKDGEELEKCKKEQESKTPTEVPEEPIDGTPLTEGEPPATPTSNVGEPANTVTEGEPANTVTEGEPPATPTSNEGEPANTATLPVQGGRRHRTPRKRRGSRKSRGKKLTIGSSRKSKTSQ